MNRLKCAATICVYNKNGKCHFKTQPFLGPKGECMFFYEDIVTIEQMTNDAKALEKLRKREDENNDESAKHPIGFTAS